IGTFQISSTHILKVLLHLCIYIYIQILNAKFILLTEFCHLEMNGLDLNSLVLQESEVSGVKWIHYRDLIAELKSGSVDYVPCNPDDIQGYGQLFAILQTRYP